MLMKSICSAKNGGRVKASGISGKKSAISHLNCSCDNISIPTPLQWYVRVFLLQTGCIESAAQSNLRLPTHGPGFWGSRLWPIINSAAFPTVSASSFCLPGRWLSRPFFLFWTSPCKGWTSKTNQNYRRLLTISAATHLPI